MFLFPVLLIAIFSGLFSGDHDAPPEEEPNGPDDTISGTEGDDILAGTSGNDLVQLAAGDDEYDSYNEGDYAGDDTVYGGDGNDIIYDEFGANTLYGENGEDWIGSVDDKSVLGSSDTIYGGDGNDYLEGDEGDTLYGGAGDDAFWAVLRNDDSAPVVIADAESGDTIDLYVPATFTETPIEYRIADNGADLIVGTDGHDLAVILGHTTSDGLTINLHAEVQNSTTNPGIVSFGTDAGRTMSGTNSDDMIFTADGQDTVYGLGGNDIISADDPTVLPADFYTTNSIVSGGKDFWGGAGDDLLYGGANDDTLRGGTGKDYLVGFGGSDTLLGGFGNDVLDGVDSDQLGGPSGFDILDGGEGKDGVYGDDGDTLTGAGGLDTFGVFYFDGNAPIEITDYDAVGNEQIIIENNGTGLGDLTLSEAGGDTLVNMDGITVAVLRAVTGVNPANISLGVLPI